MCTVTFLPLGVNNFILTSNRDEQPKRETLFPNRYVEDGIEMIFPKDKLAGGTWVGVSEKERLVCVLNGAFKKHKRKATYKKSRGVIAKEVLKAKDLQFYVNNLALEGIEPFTMVIVDWHKSLNLYELIWDGSKQYFSKLENNPKIWSSSTLYSNDIKGLRQQWFKDWQNSNEFTSKNVLKFHHSEIGLKENSVLMKRPQVETVSITSVQKNDAIIQFRYEDIISNKIEDLTINWKQKKLLPQ